jgi:hypothetical protein
MERKTGQVSGQDYIVHREFNELRVEQAEPVELKPNTWYHLPQVGEAMYRMRRMMRRVPRDGKR